MSIDNIVKNKNIMVTGGTGSFGHQIVSKLVEKNPNKILIYSRDEKKQYDLQNEFENYHDIIDFEIGDVRDYDKLYESMKGVNILYHAAALKQVPNCELHPFEAVKTNIIGAENVRRASIENEVEMVIAISTDKAVKPVNVMGMTKSIQERIILNPKNERFSTKFLCVRYGNVIGSRGSVIPFFRKRIEENKYLPITSYQMTRFLLELSEAIDLVFKATVEGDNGQLFVKKMPAAYIRDLASTMAKFITGRDDYSIKEVGVRPGEKIHEVLVSEEEMRRAEETETHYKIYPYGKIEKPTLLNNLVEYSSDKTQILSEQEIILLLKKMGDL
jgi:FlaA1/EpsC-like NDP-sugar epimerase